jgi:Ni/Co efflux regulator RcnB
MKRVLLLAVAALTMIPNLAAAQEREHGGGGRPEGGPRPGGGSPGRPGGGNPGGQRPGGGNPGAQPGPRPGGGGVPGGQRPTPQVQPARPGGDFQRPGRPGADIQRPGGPGNDNRPGRPGGDNRPGFGGDNRPGRPGGGDFHRPSNYRPPAGYWRGNSWARPPISWGGGYRYPAGYGYQRWSTGLILPSLFFSSAYYFNDYGSLGLYAPPYGYHWVRYGPDLLLVQNYTRRIVDVRYGVFR